MKRNNLPFGRFFHVKKGEPYRWENGLRGLDRALAARYRAIDLDAQITRDGVVVCTHWQRPLLRDGFRAPKGSGIRRTAKVSSLTWDQVSGLRSKDGYRIRKMSDMIRLASDRGLKIEMDAKGDHRFEWAATYNQISNAAEKYEATLLVKTMMRTGKPGSPGRRLRAAKVSGLTTLLSAQGGVVPRAWEPYIDYVRGRYIRGK